MEEKFLMLKNNYTLNLLLINFKLMKKILILIVVVFVQQCCFAQNDAARIDTLLDAYTKLSKFNGSALVAKNGTILLSKGYGYRDAKTGVLNDEHSVFQLGSVTKQFTSAVILKLQSENKLSVSDKLSKYFPDFPKGDSITIKELLTHTSGIYNYTNDENFMKNEITKPKNREQMMALFENKPLGFSPGTSWSYSNSGYSMLGYIIEKVAKTSYEEAVRNYIFSPLKMTHSGFDFTDLKSPDKTVGYFVLNAHDTAKAPIVDSTVSFSAGAIYSTTGDLYKWSQALENNTILSASEQNEAYTPVRNNYGYGWGIDSIEGKRRLAHNGGIHGYITTLSRVPADDVTIILLSNASNETVGKISNDIYAILYNKKYELPRERKAINLDEQTMKQYEGDYEIKPGLIVKIRAKDSVLIATPTGQSTKTLFAEKKDFFFEKEEDVQLDFTRNDKSEVDGFVFHQSGREIQCKKIK
jgi:CubicO group peptidase (beta-lactamase class C family)